MDFLATPQRRRILFAALYFSEGAPIGFLWLALPTRLRAADVPLERITWLTAVLVIPWTLKFAWAPLVDAIQSGRWTLKHWVISAQTLMGVTLTPLIWVNPVDSMNVLSILLIMHAAAAATQDVAIDALCISVTDPSERGRLNGWMQAGMLSGRAAMGGGALLMSSLLGDAAVVIILVAATTLSGSLLLMSHLPRHQPQRDPNDGHEPAWQRLEERQERDQHPESLPLSSRIRQICRDLGRVFRQKNTWLGLLFALTAPACFKAFEVVIGPFLIDRNYTSDEIGWFTAVIMIGAMIAGSVLGGHLADRFRRRYFVAGALVFIVISLTLLAGSDYLANEQRGNHLLVCIAMTALGIGVFTVALYALLMDLTTRSTAATQFSAFMGATNGCESWSTYTMGQVVAARGYGTGILVLCGVSLAALPLLSVLHRIHHQPHQKSHPS
ncbi:MAG: MFS transporter [Fuerstiella sp.]